MGFFSWVKSDDGEPIRNRWTEDGPTPCKMVLPDAEYTELAYDGYGVFGGADYYLELAHLNGGGDRDKGIKLDFSGIDIKRPKLVSLECKLPYDEIPDPVIDENQGYW